MTTAPKGVTKDDIYADLLATQANVRRLNEQNELFRTHVRELAIETAREQGWCITGLNDALNELDLPEVSEHITATAVIKIKIEFDGTEGDLMLADEDDIINAVKTLEPAGMDFVVTHDYTRYDVDATAYEVMDVEIIKP